MKTLILVGAGHSHVIALAALTHQLPAHMEVILISDVTHAPYSGMLPGFMAGVYTEEEITFDLSSLAKHYGVKLIIDEVVEVKSSLNLIRLAGGEELSYDCLSVNTGVLPQKIACSIDEEDRVIYVKPLSHLIVKWNKFINQKKKLNIAVVGSGSAGLEVATAISLRNLGIVTIFSHSQAVNSHYRLKENHIQIKTGATVVAYDTGKIILHNGDAYESDYVFVCTGAEPNKISGDLTYDHQGFIVTDNQLLVKHKKNVFAAGDCISFDNNPLPKAGVYAVRQGKTLAHNIAAFMTHQKMTPYVPQKNFLKILITGNKRARATKGSFSIEGRLAWKLKDFIDKKFMYTYQKLCSSHKRPSAN